jgi:hypothetical protein
MRLPFFVQKRCIEKVNNKKATAINRKTNTCIIYSEIEAEDFSLNCFGDIPVCLLNAV